MNTVQRVKYTREAADVRRSHTVPHHGDYTVGHHSFNMLCMLRILHNNPSLSLVWAVLDHDIPERMTGDIPATVKFTNIVNVGFLQQIERNISVDIFGFSGDTFLDEDEMKWLRALDILELYLWCKDQMSLGNSHILTMHSRIERIIEKSVHQYPRVCVDFYFEVKNDDWTFGPDLGE